MLWIGVPILSLWWVLGGKLDKLEKGNTRVMWFLFYAICLTLWLNINDFIFNKNLISSPHVAVFRLILFLKHMVSIGEDIMALERQTDEIKSQMPEEMVTTLSGMILQAPSTRGSCFLGFLVRSGKC
jgi:hypothetical protein